MAIKLFGGRITLGKELSQYVGRSDDFYAVMQQRYGLDYKVRNQLEAYKNVVYACVSLIGEQCGGYEPRIQQKRGDQWETLDHHPLLDLLKRPGGRDLKAASFSQFDLFEATSSYQALQGDCYWYMAIGETTGIPREIVVLRPDKVGTDIDKDTGEVTGYFIRRSVGDPIPLDIHEVLRFPMFNPKDPYKGYGTVEAGSDYIGTDEATSEFTKNFFANNAGVSGVLNIKGEVTKDAFRKFVRAWREKQEGVANAGKTAILRDSDAEFTKVGLGLDELNMDALRKMTLRDVLIMFKVPLPLLGEAEQTGMGRANVEALEYIFAKYNIEAKLKRFDNVLQFALERYFPKDATTMRVTHESVVPEDKEFELAERSAAVDKWQTRDEIRDEEGLDPTPGGDQLFVPLTQVPLNEASLTPAPPPPAKRLTVKIRRVVKKLPEPPKKKEQKPVSEKGERFRLTLMRNQKRYERQYKKILKPIFVEQRREALVNLEAHGSSLTKDNKQKYFDDAAYDALMVQELTPMLTDMTSTQGGLALIFAGDTENEFHITSDILSKLQRGTQKMATNFNDETITKLNTTLAQGIQNGEGLGDLKNRVSDVYDDVDGYRAERIARTETLKASNAATLEAYKQTGYVTGSEWAVNPSACEQCQEFAGMTVPLGDAFLGLGESYTVTDDEGNDKIYTNDYDTVEAPPLHPNCECTIVPVSDSFNALDPDVEKILPASDDLKDKAYIKELENTVKDLTGMDDGSV